MANPIPSRAVENKERDDYLRNRQLAEDPMRDYFQKEALEKLGNKYVEIPKYKGPYSPNRYNIRPGYRWDGVDRSNGYEAKLVKSQAAKIAGEEENHRLMTQDM